MINPQGDGDAIPCFYEYYGTPAEVATSLLSAAAFEPAEENQAKENTYCPYSYLKPSAQTDSNLEDVCTSEAYEWRVCRADNRGVMELPPGDNRCLIHVNGNSAAVGVLSASGYTGMTSGLGMM